MNTPNTPAKASPGNRQVKPAERFSLVEEFASKHAIEASRVLPLLRATAFRVKQGDNPATDEELLQLMLVARVYNLNPFTKEIYAFRSKLGGLVPIIGADGWVRIVEAQPEFAGHQERFGFDDTLGPDGKTELGFYAECEIHRNDRKFPVVHRAYFKENVRSTEIWASMPCRMLGHRAYIQAARRAFGLGGIYDEDEGEVIATGTAGVDVIRPREPPRAPDPPRSTQSQAEEPFATEDQLVQIGEAMAKSGLPDNFVLAKFEVGTFQELRSNQVLDVLKFIKDNV